MTLDEMCFLSATQLVAAYGAGELSPVDVTRAVLDRIARLNPSLNAFCTMMADDAMQTAQRAEEVQSRGELLGPLHGVPVSIKDNLYVKGVRTTFGSKLLENNVTQEDAPVTERLRRAGAVLIGRTNTPEYGWKGVTDNRVFGVTRNPWDLEKTPGGSSGGAAAAVAAGLGPIGIGTDGGGSIRIPAGFCGLVGLKASFGRVPNYPATAVDSLRHTGPLARTVTDAALMLNVLAGPDERDPSSLPHDPTDYVAQLDGGLTGVRIAYSADLGFAEVDAEVARLAEQAAQRFRDAGAAVEPLDLNWQDPFDCWKVLFYGGIAATLGDQLAERSDQLDPGLRESVEQGVKLRAVDFVQASLGRAAFWQGVRKLFDRFDLLVTPSLAVPAFAVGRNDPEPPPGHQGRALRWTPFTYPFNLTGQPAVSVPCEWTSGGLPVGVQVVGRRFDDAGVLRAARTLEQLQPWVQRRPEGLE